MFFHEVVVIAESVIVLHNFFPKKETLKVSLMSFFVATYIFERRGVDRQRRSKWLIGLFDRLRS